VTSLLNQVADAGLALLAADTALSVYDGSLPNPTPARPYVLVYTVVSRPPDDTQSQALDALTSRAEVRWICHCVGDNQLASRAVAERVAAALLDQRITVQGLACGFIRDEQDDPPTRNEQTGVVVIDSVHVYRVTVDS
jgi:hypothetical protein